MKIQLEEKSITYILLVFLFAFVQAKKVVMKPTPYDQLLKTLNSSLPKDSPQEWLFAGRIEFATGELVIFDPSFYIPSLTDSRHIYDLTTDVPAGIGSVFVHRVMDNESEWYNASVKVLFSDQIETQQEKVGSVGVDSATLAIASASTLPGKWQVGGLLSKSSIWIDFMSKDARKAKGAVAAQLLQSAGFNLRQGQVGDWLYDFVLPLTDKEIYYANEILKNASIPGYVNTYVHHSASLIQQQLDTNQIAQLNDPGHPYLVAFMSGWGDGYYDCFALKNDSQTIGFLCEMIKMDEL